MLVIGVWGEELAPDPDPFGNAIGFILLVSLRFELLPEMEVLPGTPCSKGKVLKRLGFWLYRLNSMVGCVVGMNCGCDKKYFNPRRQQNSPLNFLAR